MAVIGSFHRFTTLLVVFILSAIFGCTSSKDQDFDHDRDRCRTGSTHRNNNPRICVDAVTLQATPDHAIVWDLEKDLGQWTNRPVWITWETTRGATLGIIMRDKGCVTDLRCNGPVCTAKVQNTNAPDEVRRNRPGDPTPYVKECRYELTLDGRVADPELEINPCCW